MTRGARENLPLEWIEEDEVPVGRPPRRPPYPLLLVAVAGVLVAVVAVLPKGRGAIPPTPSTVPATTAVPVAAPVETSTAARPVMEAPPGWELIGRGSGLVVRIELHAGRVTRTTVPSPGSSGPVYLVAGADRVIVRPLDFVPGYAVPDGQPAEPLSGLLGNGGPAFPGPDSQHLWVEAETGGRRRMELVGFDGTPTGIFIPGKDTFPYGPDGTGYLLFTDAGGAYLGQPRGITRITSGQLLAAGATRWLARECDTRACHLVVTDRATGKARVLSTGLATDPPPFPLPISPDGIEAAFADTSDGGPVLHILNLATGRDRPVGRLPSSGGGASMVWSPDSRALFFVDDLGALQVVDLAAMRAKGLGIALPPMYQLAFRVKSTP